MNRTDGFSIRPAALEDLPALRTLIDTSVRTLSVGYLTPKQIEAELRYVISPDTQLIADGTYFVAVAADNSLAGSGGWSRRRKLHGGDQYRQTTPEAAADSSSTPDPDALVDPATEPARIRAMFTSPAWKRRGVARRIFETSRAAAAAEGFRSLILTATMPGVPLYEALGFEVSRRYRDVLPDGHDVPVAEMVMRLGIAPR